MRVRIVRHVDVKPERLTDFAQLSLKVAEHVERETKIRPDVYWAKFNANNTTVVKIFMDFDSMADYEDLFLEGMLFDKTYLTLTEQGAAMIKQEPNDGLMVLMDKDDFFMNLKNPGRRPTPAEPPRGSQPPRRFRIERHVDVSTGQLREFMRQTFVFMDQFQRVVGMRPSLYCTRFTQERIGCGKLYIDFDDCPMCDSILMQHTRELASQPGLIEREPIDEMYVRLTPGDVAFDLKAAASGVP